MFKFLSNLVIIFVLVVTYTTYKNSTKTFEAKFNHIDGLPIGAPVSALGVNIGKVIKTTPVEDGIVVTIRITNKSAPLPPTGATLEIAFISPGGGRRIEIVYPDKTKEGAPYLVNEPISTETWLHASIEIVEGLKKFSKATIDAVNPENVRKVRTSLEGISSTLNTTANTLRKYEGNLESVQDGLTFNADKAKSLVNVLRGSVEELNEIVSHDNFKKEIKGDLSEFSKNLSVISKAVQDPEFVNKIGSSQEDVIKRLNNINIFLVTARQNINDMELKERIKNFNEYVKDLNGYYSTLEKEGLKPNLKKKLKDAREGVTELEEATSNL